MRNWTRRGLALVCAAVLAAGLAGCGGKTPPPEESAPPAPQTPEAAPSAGADSQVQALAERYGISEEKVERILAVFLQVRGGSYTFEELAGLPMEELDRILAESEAAVASAGAGAEVFPSEQAAPAATPTPAPSAGAYIGEAAAKAAALTHAGVAEADASFVQCKLDYDDGRAEYEVEFRAGGMEYEYDIDALTGQVLQYQRERDDRF